MPSPFYSILFCFFLFFIDSFGLVPPSNNNNNNNNNKNNNNKNNNNINIKEETVLRKKSYEDRKKRESVLSNDGELYAAVDGTGTDCTSSLPCDVVTLFEKCRSLSDISLLVQSGDYSSFYPYRVILSNYAIFSLSGWMMSDNNDGGLVISSDISTYPLITWSSWNSEDVFIFFPFEGTVNIQYIYFVLPSSMTHNRLFECFFVCFIILIYNFIRSLEYSSSFKLFLFRSNCL
jgi:hypothetical protein